MADINLKPCPFCGGEAEIVEQKHREYASTFYVRCKGYCIKQHDFRDKERAVEAWNTRKPIEKILEWLDEHCFSLADFGDYVIQAEKIGKVIEEGVDNGT